LPDSGGPGDRYFVGSAEFRDGSENHEVQALDIHRIMCKALGYSPATDPNDVSLPEAKVSNLTTDTTAVMPKTAQKLGTTYRLFKGMNWTPCSCHTYNLYLVDQEKAFKSIRALISRGRLVVTLFRNSAPRKLFQRYYSSSLDTIVSTPLHPQLLMHNMHAGLLGVLHRLWFSL
jgi:hypothetical protein